MPTWTTGNVAANRPWQDHIASITTVIIGDNVTVIAGFAFNDQAALTSVTIGADVTDINGGAFRNTGLTSIEFKGSTPPSMGSTNIFNSVATSNVNVTVPVGAGATYKTSALVGSPPTGHGFNPDKITEAGGGGGGGGGGGVPPTGLPDLTSAATWMWLLIALSLALWGYVGWSYVSERRGIKRG